MLKKLKTKDQGFTIIEVMIVLAIAGLILLIVFLAVPALQRTSRDTQRKNDVSAMLSAISTTSSNNGGRVVDDVDLLDLGGNTKIGYYDPTKVTITCLQSISKNLTVSQAAACPKGSVSAPKEDEVHIYQGAKCGSVSGKPTAVQGSLRQTAVLYQLEANPTVTCQES